MSNKPSASKIVAIMRMALARIETLPMPEPRELKEEKTFRRAKLQADFPCGGEVLDALRRLQGNSLLLVPFHLESAQTLGRDKSDLSFFQLRVQNLTVKEIFTWAKSE